MPYLISFEFYLKWISYQFENLKIRFIIFIILTGYFFNIKMHGKKRQKEHKLSFSLNMLKNETLFLFLDINVPILTC